jgi:hypothetical protein
MKVLLGAGLAGAIAFGTAGYESWIALKVFQWHVPQVAAWLMTQHIGLWQLVWLNLGASLMLRHFQGVPEDSDPVKWWKAIGVFMFVSPTLLLALAWLAKVVAVTW